MDSTALFSGFVGAVIGSATSLATLVVQNVFQNRRESQRLLFETAFKDYELRILHLPQNRAAFPVILAYHQKMTELIESRQLTPVTSLKDSQRRNSLTYSNGVAMGKGWEARQRGAGRGIYCDRGGTLIHGSGHEGAVG